MRYQAAKKYIVLFLALLAALCLSGCMQVVLKVDVNRDGGGKLEAMIGIQEQYYEMATQTDGTDPFQQIIDSAKNQDGISASKYKENGYQGIRVKQKVQNLTTLSQMGSTTEDLTENLTFTMTEENGKKVYSVSGKADIQSALDNQGVSKTQLLAMGDAVDLRFVVTFPYKVTEHNGTELSDDGRTVTWDLLKFDKETLSAKAVEDGSGFGSALLIILLVLLAAAFGLFLYNALKKKKGSSSSAQQKAAGGQRDTAARQKKTTRSRNLKKQRPARNKKTSSDAQEDPAVLKETASDAANAQELEKSASSRPGKKRPARSPRPSLLERFKQEERADQPETGSFPAQEQPLPSRCSGSKKEKLKKERSVQGFTRRPEKAISPSDSAADGIAKETQQSTPAAKEETQKPDFTRKRSATSFGYAPRKGSKAKRGKQEKPEKLSRRTKGGRRQDSDQAPQASQQEEGKGE